MKDPGPSAKKNPFLEPQSVWVVILTKETAVASLAREMAAALRYQNPNPSPNFKIRDLKPPKSRSTIFNSRRHSNLRSIRSEIASLDRSGGGGGAHVAHSSSQSLMASTAVASMASFLSNRSKKNVCLFYCEEMRELAERVAMEGDAIELRSISWRWEYFFLLSCFLRKLSCIYVLRSILCMFSFQNWNSRNIHLARSLC